MSGFSLFEVLLSLFLLSFMLLEMDVTQWHAMHKANEAHDFSVATLQIKSFVQLPASVREQYFSLWNQQNREILPKGRGVWTGDEVVVMWGDTKIEDCQETKAGLSGCIKLKTVG